MPPELELLNAIDRFGAQAVLGRPLGANEIRAMNIAEAVKISYRSRERAENQVFWARDHEAEDKLLTEAMLAAIERGLLDGE